MSLNNNVEMVSYFLEELSQVKDKTFPVPTVDNVLENLEAYTDGHWSWCLDDEKIIMGGTSVCTTVTVYIPNRILSGRSISPIQDMATNHLKAIVDATKVLVNNKPDPTPPTNNDKVFKEKEEVEQPKEEKELWQEFPAQPMELKESLPKTPTTELPQKEKETGVQTPAPSTPSEERIAQAVKNEKEQQEEMLDILDNFDLFLAKHKKAKQNNPTPPQVQNPTAPVMKVQPKKVPDPFEVVKTYEDGFFIRVAEYPMPDGENYCIVEGVTPVGPNNPYNEPKIISYLIKSSEKDETIADIESLKAAKKAISPSAVPTNIVADSKGKVKNNPDYDAPQEKYKGFSQHQMDRMAETRKNLQIKDDDTLRSYIHMWNPNFFHKGHLTPQNVDNFFDWCSHLKRPRC